MASDKKRISFRRNRSSNRKPGAAPGTITHEGEKRVDEITVNVYDYDLEQLDEVTIDDISACEKYLNSPSKSWIKIQGLHDVEMLKSIGKHFNLHPLIQEDIVSTSQRPKVEQYENCTFIVMRMLRYHAETKSMESEQLSFVLGENYVISFQETDQPIFDPVINRLIKQTGRLRSMGVDYLAYALIDNATDHYFTLLDALGDQLEQVEDEILEDPDESTFHAIHALRKDVVFARKSIWPTRDMLNALIRDDSKFIDESVKIYIRDVYDHVVQIIDNIENYRDVVMGMHDMYMSYVSNKMNEVMKVLTIIATIFIPLTFIAGIYGMNFNPESSPYSMPELSWYWGYPAAWSVMIIVAIIMIIYFKKKDWL